MKKFMDEEFLLSNDTASALFHEYAEKLPIIDYHCHVSPKEIAENKKFSNITELWLGGDHYKWRTIRSNGVDEKYITGDSSDYEKFREFARVMPKLIGNPMYHWTHLELKRYFDCDLTLSESTCDEIWNLCNEKLQSEDMRVKSIITKSNVKMICTTDDPVDSLEYHEIIKADKDFGTQVLPAFRPDKAFAITKAGYADYIKRLSEVSGVEVVDFKSIKEALAKRLDHFEAHGCRTSDHAFDNGVEFCPADSLYELDNIFKKAVESDGKEISADEYLRFKSSLMLFLSAEYKKRGWVMQIHYGADRNVNSRMFSKLGPDTGFDIIDGRTGVSGLARMLDAMLGQDGLGRTIIYSLNPIDNAAIGSLLGGFQSSNDGMPLVMQGSAWWFNDNKTGMHEQMTSLANLSVFGNFIGMLTDSRSFVSYPRHEYFRRILCNFIGTLVENGEYPDDFDSLAQIVMDICYNNTKNYFGFEIL
ncbi:MAG: glucuronate isomerase [Clostridia bacterium]|nr:glucuronate isomerase [Clostridia bacterium]